MVHHPGGIKKPHVFTLIQTKYKEVESNKLSLQIVYTLYRWRWILDPVLVVHFHQNFILLLFYRLSLIAIYLFW